MKETTKSNKNDEFKEEIDYYFDEGLMVLTENYLLRRGFCCENGCRHCPYSQSKNVSNSLDPDTRRVPPM